MPTARINGIDLYFEVHGEGPPLLFAHGQVWLTGTDEALFAPLRYQAQFLSVNDGTLAATFS